MLHTHVKPPKHREIRTNEREHCFCKEAFPREEDGGEMCTSRHSWPMVASPKGDAQTSHSICRGKNQFWLCFSAAPATAVWNRSGYNGTLRIERLSAHHPTTARNAFRFADLRCGGHERAIVSAVLPVAGGSWRRYRPHPDTHTHASVGATKFHGWDFRGFLVKSPDISLEWQAHMHTCRPLSGDTS